MSNPEVNGNEQMDASNPQDKINSDPDKKAAEKQRIELKVKAKSVKKQITVGNPRIAPPKQGDSDLQ